MPVLGFIEPSAECNPAIRQIKNLRYVTERAHPATLHIFKTYPIHFFTGALAISAAKTWVSPNMFARNTTHFLSGVMLTFGSPSLP